jgi:hypothetical protein
LEERFCLADPVAGLCFGLRAGNAETRFALDQDQPALRWHPAQAKVGLVVDALQSAGFTLLVLDEVASAGPDMVAPVYLSGIGLQCNGDDYFRARSMGKLRVPLQAVHV